MAEQADVRADPVRQRLRPGYLCVRVVRRAQHGDEDLRHPNLAAQRIADLLPLARIVDEHLVASDVVLAHDRRQPLLILPQELTKPAVSVSVRPDLPIFFPQNEHRDCWPPQLTNLLCPVRLLTLAHTGAEASALPRTCIKALFKHLITDFVAKRPDQLCRFRALKCALNGRAGNARDAYDIACRVAFVKKTQNTS